MRGRTVGFGFLLIAVAAQVRSAEPATRDLVVGGLAPNYPPSPTAALTYRSPALPLNHFHGAMMTADLTPDGKWAATGSGHPSSPGELVLWDLESGRERWSLRFRRGVRTVRFSPDARRLATGRYDGTIEFYTVPDGETVLRIVGHAAGVNALAWTPDGDKVLTAGLDGVVNVWDAATGQSLSTFRGHAPGRILSVDVAPDGSSAASAGDDAAIRVWDLRSGQPQTELAGHDGYVEQVRFTPDGKTLLAAGSDGRIRAWDLQTGEPRELPSEQSDLIVGLAIAPDGRLAAAGRLTGRLELFDLETGERRHDLPAHAGGVFGLVFSSDGKTLLSASFDGTAKLWDAAAGRERTALVRGFAPGGEPQPVAAATWSPDGRSVITGHADGTLCVTDVESGRVTARVSGHAVSIVALALGPDGKQLWSVDSSGDAKVRNADPFPPDGADDARSFRTGGRVAAAAIDARSGTLAAGAGRAVGTWSLETGAAGAVAEGLAADVAALAVARGGDLIAVGGSDGRLTLCEPDGDGRRVSDTGHAGPIRAVAFSRDALTVATGGDDGTIRLWDVPGRGAAAAEPPLRPRLTVTGAPPPVTALLFADASHGLIAAGGPGEVGVWDPRTGTRLDRLDGHRRPVTALALASGTETLVTCDEAGAGFVWDRDAVGRPLTPLAVMPVHPDGARNVLFTPDGTRLVSDGYDNHARVWDLAAGEVEHSFPRATSGVQLSADGRLLAVSDWNRGFAVYDLATGTDEYRFQGLDRGADEIAFSPDGRLLLASVREFGAKLYDLTSDATGPAVALAPQPLPFRGLDFSPAGDSFATATGDYKQSTVPGEVTIWDAATGQPRKRYAGHEGEVKCVRFSPDGRRLATGGADKRVIVWDVESGRALATLSHPSSVFAVRFVPESDLLLTGDYGGAVAIWNADTGDLLDRSKLHDNFITRLAVSPDATVLATASKDGSVKLWALAGKGNDLRIVSAAAGKGAPAP